MNTFRKALLGLAAAAAMSAPGLALAQTTFPPSSVIIVNPDGRVLMTPVAKKDLDTGMTHAKLADGPVMLLEDHGKLYLVQDARMKMASGQTMIDYFSRLYSNPGG